ncbi:hypothetical protein E1301_Tti002590 [Triplophysa tibetana]|uniref:Uncharacterized protein n=1 Tax=Triplophysa tibetana TaxID=1572043 RepID=A0A5A9NEI2_9TELE|nr:hypothetical protein E1301_Tti002590 [Triplophysa tibetana]
MLYPVTHSFLSQAQETTKLSQSSPSARTHSTNTFTDQRMAVFMTMNELWKRIALGLMFCLLLIHSCHGQENNTAIQSQAVFNDTTGVELTDQINNASLSNQTTEIINTGSATDATNATTRATISITHPLPHISTSSLDKSPDAIRTTAQTTRLVVTSTNPSSATTAMKTKSTQEAEIISGENKSLTYEEPEEKKEKASGSYGVFWGVLVTGLLLAAGILGTFCFKRHRTTNGKGGMKLAEESYMADEENQGNTLVSVAPLNQPEPQEKPSLNGESPEGLITQTPPAATNGHSTTKTADTEL